MLTRADRTVPDALDVLDDVRGLGLRHVGFKDVGAPAPVVAALSARIRELGATSYLEIVSTTRDGCLAAARLAREAAVDRVLGGTCADEVLAILAGSRVEYLPFPGRTFGHPTQLAATARDIEDDCRSFAERGCAGVDVLAYRSTGAEPLELVRAARRATPGIVLVAGGVRTRTQIEALAAAGADAFTVGSAVFDGSIAPEHGSIRSQLRAVIDACG